MSALYVHASAAVVGSCGVIVLGPSGSGKSALVEALLDEARRRGAFARWIGDDRIGLSAAGGRLIARPHAALAGRVERRFQGIEAAPHEAAAVLALAVRLDPQARRLPEDPVYCALGLSLPALIAPPGFEPAARRIYGRLSEMF